MKTKPAGDATKLKRIRVWAKIHPRSIDGELEGLLLKAVETLTKMHINAVLRGWKDITIVQDGDYEGQWLELHGTRLETDAEMRRRFAKVRKERAKAPKKKK